jgi:hypothetical protein
VPSDYLVIRIGDKKLKVKKCNYASEEHFKKVFTENLSHIAETLKKALQPRGEEDIEEGLVLCGREVKLLPEGGTLLFADALLLDTTDGTPIIVEAKLATNREAKREVLGQILEYMTLGYLNPKTLMDKCSDTLAGEDKEGILEKMKEKLEQKRIVGLIVADQLSEVIKQVIEVFNDDLENFNLLGMELERYCSKEEDVELIIPMLVGVSAKKRAALSRRSKGRLWRYEDLKKYIGGIKNKTPRKRALEILEWAHKNNLLVEEGETVNPVIKIANIATGKTIARIYLHDGSIEVNIGPESESSYPEPSLRNTFFQDLKKMNLIDLESPDETIYSKHLSKKLDELTEDEYMNLFKTIKKYALHTGETS